MRLLDGRGSDRLLAAGIPACPSRDPFQPADIERPPPARRSSRGTSRRGLRSTPVAEPSLAFGILGIEPFVVALPLKHRLWARDRIAFSDLAGEPFVLLARAIVPVFHDLVVGLCREAGFAPNLTHEIDQPQAALALVAVGAGISLVPASVRDTRPRGIVFRPLHPSRLVQTALAWRRDVASPLVNAFVQAVPRLWRRE
jgi:DNA-binding transcriptional LysR family regulator